MADIIEDVVDVTITATSATPSLPGFNIPAVIAYHTHNTDLIRFYTSLSAMVADSFTTSEPAYRMAQSILAQSPHVKKFAVIRATSAIAQTFTLTVTDNTNGHQVGCTIVAPDGTETACYHTVSSETTTQVATAVASLIDALANIAAVGSGAVVTATGGTAGQIWYAYKLQGCDFADTTADATPEADLNATVLVDNTWYGISGAWLSSANIAKIAAWAQSNKKLHGYTTADAANKTAGSGVMHTMKTDDYDRTYGDFSATPQTYSGTGLMGKQLSKTPGASNWAFKSVQGTPVDNLTETEQGHITTNNGNYYTTLGGVPVMFDGRTASGQYIDITVGVDSLERYVQLRVATLLTTLERLPFTRAGISMARAAVMAGIQDSVRDGFLTEEAGFEPQITMPALEDIPPSDKAARLLEGIQIVAYAQGAINKVKLNITVNA